MKFLQRSKKRAGRTAYNSEERRASAPVLRYYRPSSSKKITTTKERFQPELSKDSPLNAKRVAGALLRRLGIVLIVLALVINTTLASTVSIDIARGQEVLYQSTATYNKTIEDIVGKSIWNKSKFALRSNRLEREIVEAIPEVENASVIIPLAGRKLLVKIRMAEPLIRIQLNEADEQGVIGTNGTFVYQESSGTVNSRFAQLPLLIMADIEAVKGQQLLTTTELELVSLLIDEFDESEPYRFRLRSIEFDVPKREMKLRFNGVDFFARVTPESSGREQVGALVATVKQLSSDNKLPKEYIDVRAENRVFIK